MDYISMYIVFSVLFVFGGTAYWVVTSIFANESKTYESQSVNAKTT